MKAKKWYMVSIAVLGIALFAAMSSGKEGKEKIVELPSLVMAAIVNLFPSGVVEKTDMEKEGVAIFDVDLKSGDNVSVSKDGVVVSVSSTVSVESLPAAVAAAIKEKAKDAKILVVEKEEQKAEVQLVSLAVPKVTYEAKVDLNGKVMEIKTDAAGTVLEMKADEGDKKGDHDGDDDGDDDGEQVIALDKLPDAVRTAIVKASEGGTVKEVVSEQENGKMTYEAEVVISGQEFEIKVDADGKVLEKKADKEGDHDDDKDKKSDKKHGDKKDKD